MHACNSDILVCSVYFCCFKIKMSLHLFEQTYPSFWSYSIHAASTLLFNWLIFPGSPSRRGICVVLLGKSFGIITPWLFLQAWHISNSFKAPMKLVFTAHFHQYWEHTDGKSCKIHNNLVFTHNKYDKTAEKCCSQFSLSLHP